MLLISAHANDTKCAPHHKFLWNLLCKLICLWPSCKDRHWILLFKHTKKRFFLIEKSRPIQFPLKDCNDGNFILRCKRVGNPTFLIVPERKPAGDSETAYDGYIAQCIFSDFLFYLTEWEIFFLHGFNKWPLVIHRIQYEIWNNDFLTFERSSFRVWVKFRRNKSQSLFSSILTCST